jgi:hypothetical protein
VPPRRRLGALLAVLALVGVPAIALRASCFGKTCAQSPGPVHIPFCPLPDDVKSLIVNGFYKQRSPDVMGVATGAVTGGTTGSGADVPWPSTESRPDTRVPIGFVGPPFAAGAPVPDGTGLDQIAPTIADAIGFDRPHPDVRAGKAIVGVARTDIGSAYPSRPLIVEIVWSGIGTTDLQQADGAWPYLRSVIDGSKGSGTLDGTTGSLPLDPVATLTTIGTGGLPSQHGVVAAYVRNDDDTSPAVGQVVPAWGKGSPPSVIATLPDDLDHSMGGRPLVGLIAPDPSDRGLVGGGWYQGSEPDDLIYGSADPARSVETLLGRGYGHDGVPDVMGIVLGGSPIRTIDSETRAIVEGVQRKVPLAGFAIAATGTLHTGAAPLDAAEIGRHVDDAVSSTQKVVQAIVPGGLFLDQHVLASLDVSSNAVVTSMLDEKTDGRKVFADAFPSFAVSFARYC